MYTQRHRFPIRDITIFAVLGTLMYISFAIMQGLPNIHPVAAFIGAVTLVYRVRALIPIYIYVLLYGIFSGFSFFWLPYLYIWLPLWLMFMLFGRFELSEKFNFPVSAKAGMYMAACALHGLLFGVMYAPVQAVFFGLSFEGLVAWIIAGLPYDIIHGISNLLMAAMIIPLSDLIKKIA